MDVNNDGSEKGNVKERAVTRHALRPLSHV